MRARSVSASFCAAVVALVLSLPTPERVSAQVIVTQPSGNDGIRIFPTPTTGLPSPASVEVTGLPQFSRPHGVACFDDDTCVTGDLQGDGTNDRSRLIIVKVSTASVVGTLPTANKFGGPGTVAVNRARTHVLALGGALASLGVVATPVTPTSTVNAVALPDGLAPFATAGIAFDAGDRAFVCHTTGVSVLDPPYASIAFTIPLAPGCLSVALTPDGSKLLVPTLTVGQVEGAVRIFTAPFSAASTFETLPIPGATNTSTFTNLQGIAVSPDGTVALVVNALNAKLWSIAAPFSSTSHVERIPLPPTFLSGLEDVAFSPDGQLAIVTGNGTNEELIPFVRAPFTAAGATVHLVPIPGGRGNGAARFVRSTPPPPNCGPSNDVVLAPVTLGVEAEATPVAPLAAAVLPVSRSVQVGCPATAFVTVINAGAETAQDVAIAPATSVPGSFLYQTTNPATNALTGKPNTPADIPAGQLQSFVVAFTPTAAFPPTDVTFAFAGTNTFPVPPQTGLNTLLLSASPAPVPDVVALAATVTNDGIVNVPGAGGTGAFSVATVNLGLGAAITVSVDTGTTALPVNLFVCQTDPGTGQCLQPPAPTVATAIPGGATPTFTILVQGKGVVPFDPAGNRVFVRFKDAQGATRGSTSVAVRTQ